MQYSGIANLPTLQFTVTDALGFSVFTSCVLAMDLWQSHWHFESHMKFPLHLLIPLLSLFCNCQFRRLQFNSSVPKFISRQAGVSKLDTTPLSLSLMLRPTVSRPVCLDIKHPSGAYDQIFFPFGIRNASDSYVLDSVGRPLWREDGSVFCMCRWPLPAQSVSGPSPLGLATVFYCLRFETSLFVASYDSQGHGGGIRPRLHTGPSQLNSSL
jgi:hypothetical protein